MYKSFFKRFFDFLGALIALIALSWLLIIVALLVRFKLGSPVLFSQARPGKNERIFHIYKFRTMTDAKDAQGHLLPDAERLPPFGRFLRSTSLDELPEFFNILRGDMSFIGPRPLLVRYLPRYSEFQRRRHEVRPGLSGLAQVSGRNALSWEDKFRLDVQYVDNVSFLGDCKIVFLTLLKVFKREGISAAGEATMGEFLGSSASKESGSHSLD